MYKKEEERRERGEETCNRLFRSTFGVSESFLCAVEMQKVAFHFCFFWTVSKSARISFFTSLSGESFDLEKVAKVRNSKRNLSGLWWWSKDLEIRLLAEGSGFDSCNLRFFSGEPTVLIFVRYFVHTKHARTGNFIQTGLVCK